jgi:hypothetical protein
MQSKRGKKRYTIDNRLCQTPFKHKGKYFFDCTSIEAPDNSQTGREWCYVDTPLANDKTWEYCITILDYDKVREFVQSEMKRINIQVKKQTEEVKNTLAPARGALDELRKLKDSQSHISIKLAELAKDILNISNNLINLSDLKNRWRELEVKTTLIGEEIERKALEKISLEATNINKVLEVSPDVLKAEEKLNKQNINPSIQFKQLDSSFDCQGKMLYEDAGAGVGVIAQYFNNADFLGEFSEAKETNIDFDWTGDAPAESINASVFSARFEGFLLAPVGSNYFFSVECDDGCQLAVNDEIIISHKMNFTPVDSKERVEKWLSYEVAAKISPSGLLYKSSSKRLFLLGGSKYKITVWYSHSVHNDSQDSGRAFLKLTWGSEEFEERIISQKDLFSESANPPLKITGVNWNNVIVRKLLENDLAFKDSSKYLLQDIPQDYAGATCLKLETRFKEFTLDFEVNIPTYVYVARLAHFPKCLTSDWENTGERLSILELNTNPINNYNNQNLGQNVFESVRSGLMKIYRKKFDAGSVSIPLNHQSINAKGIPLVVFFGSDNSLINPVSCGGAELWLSNPTSDNYESCSSSSFWEANWKCENGLNGVNRDSEGSMWASRREAIGAWIEISFKKTFYLTRVEIKNRRNPQERNSLIEVSFENGKKQLIKLPNSDNIISISLDPPTKSSKIRFSIKGSYGAINNGGAFKVFGLECKDIDNEILSSGNYVNTAANGAAAFGGVNPKALAPLFKPQEKPAVLLLCKDSLANTKKLEHVKSKPGSLVKVKCLQTCFDSRYKIYGDLKYSKDSAICKAAFHADILKKPQESFWIKFEVGLSLYPSQMRNGVKSSAKTYSDLSIKFETAVDLDNVIINTGSKLDVLDPKGSGTWLPMVITNIIDSGLVKKLSLILESAEGASASDSESFTLDYPNKNQINTCGAKITKRVCTGSAINSESEAPITIKFQPANYRKKTKFLVDSGSPFGKAGKSYGWDRDMSNRLRARVVKSNDSILETFVEFPPDENSKFCNSQKPEVVCDKANWSAKVGFGKFKVKLYIGDPITNTRVDLAINGIPIAKQTTIEKGKIEVFEGVFDSVNEFITIGTKCLADCDYSMAKLNMVEISPYKEDKNKKEIKELSAVVEDPCGNAQFGGKCDVGPDVINCLFDDPMVESAKFCSGNSFMVQIPPKYRCASQQNKFKCVLRKFEDQSACLKYCPFNCTKGICNA